MDRLFNKWLRRILPLSQILSLIFRLYLGFDFLHLFFDCHLFGMFTTVDFRCFMIFLFFLFGDWWLDDAAFDWILKLLFDLILNCIMFFYRWVSVLTCYIICSQWFLLVRVSFARLRCFLLSGYICIIIAFVRFLEVRVAVIWITLWLSNFWHWCNFNLVFIVFSSVLFRILLLR